MPVTTASARPTAPLRPLACLVAVCLCFALTTSASARVSYPSPQTLSEAGQNAYSPQVAIDGSDRPTVVWSRSDGTNSRIQAVRIGPLGNPGPIKTLSAAGEAAAQANLAIDSADRATVTWVREAGGIDTRIQVVRLAADGTPGAVQNLTEAGEYAENPKVAIDGSDRATIVWRGWDGTSYRVHSVRLAADGTPGPDQFVSKAGPAAFGPQVAIDGAARATITWMSSEDLGYDIDPINSIRSVRLAADGTPGPVRNLSGSSQDVSSWGDIGIDGSDRAVITWERWEHSGDASFLRVQEARLAADGTPGPVQTLSPPGQSAGNSQVAIDGSGRATVLWGGFQFVRIGADGTPGPIQTLSLGETPSPLGIAFDGSDRATIAWEGRANRRIAAARVAADGTPGAVQTLSEAGQPASNPQVAIDGSGRATIVWRRFDGANERIQSVRAEITYPETTISSGPAGLTSDPSPSFGFSADLPGASFACSLDRTPYGVCASPQAYSMLPDGPHHFAVRAIDAEGDADPTPAERSFEVDTAVSAACRRATKKLGKAERKLERRKQRLGRASRGKAKRRARRKVRRARAELARAEERVDAVC